jgi:hypothetical protein
MTNPYTYTEEPAHPVTTWDSETEAGQEPVTPFEISLSRGIFVKCTTLSVFHDRCELSGGQLDGTVIPRNEAAKRIWVTTQAIVFRSDSGSRWTFRYKRDQQRELKLARLETWCKQSWSGDPLGAYHSVFSLLKRNVCTPVFGLLLFFATMQIGFFAIQLVSFLIGEWEEDVPFAFVLLTIYASPALISLFFAAMLWLRQIWALILGTVFSLFPWLVVTLLLFAPDVKIRVIISLLLFVCLLATYCFTNAVIRYYSQRKYLVASWLEMKIRLKTTK